MFLNINVFTCIHIFNTYSTNTINTLQHDQQKTLIKNTINSENEEDLINQVLNDYKIPDKPFTVYGKNSCDDSVNKKYDQLISTSYWRLAMYQLLAVLAS